MPPAAATPTCPLPSAKPPSAPAAPSRSSAPNTSGWPGGCPRRKPWSRPATRCSPSFTPGSPTQKRATRTSARPTTSSACTPTTTSAASNASATRSPSRPSTPTPANSSPQSAKSPSLNPQPVSADAPPGAAASPAEVPFSDQARYGRLREAEARARLAGIIVILGPAKLCPGFAALVQAQVNCRESGLLENFLRPHPRHEASTLLCATGRRLVGLRVHRDLA